MLKLMTAIALGCLLIVPATASASHKKRHHGRSAKHAKAKSGKRSKHAANDRALMSPSWT